MHKFLIPPDAPAYTVTDGQEAARTQLEGGRGRYRKDILNASYTVKVSWTFDRAKFNYWRAFYKSVSESASMPFLIDLLIDTSDELQEHTVNIVPNSVITSEITGHRFKVDAQLEVTPFDFPDGYFESIVLGYEIAGEDYYDFDLAGLFDELSHLVNEVLPSLDAFNA